MTPHYTLIVGGMTVFEGFTTLKMRSLGSFPNQKAIRQVAYGPGEDDTIEKFAYRTTAQVLAERLDLMGFTARGCRAEFFEAIKDYSNKD